MITRDNIKRREPLVEIGGDLRRATRELLLIAGHDRVDEVDSSGRGRRRGCRVVHVRCTTAVLTILVLVAVTRLAARRLVFRSTRQYAIRFSFIYT